MSSYPSLGPTVALVVSVQGVGYLLGCHLCVATDGFTCPLVAKRFSAWLGVCPAESVAIVRPTHCVLSSGSPGIPWGNLHGQPARPYVWENLRSPLSLAVRDILSPGIPLDLAFAVRLVFATLCASALSASPITAQRLAPNAAAAVAADTVRAQSASFRVREWTVDDGLPTPVHDIAQTADGYLWLATSHGLFRFDGIRFVGFTTQTVPQFSDDDFISVYAAHNGDLWVGTRGTKSYRLRDGVWLAVDAGPAIGDHWVQGFAEDADGTLWINGTGDRVGRLVDGAWTPVATRIRNVWTQLVADADGSIWTYLPADAAPDQPIAGIRNGVVARWDGDRFVPPGDDRQRIGFEATTHGPLFQLPTDTVDNGRQRIDLSAGTGRRVGWFSQGDVPLAARLVDRRGYVWLESATPEVEGVIVVQHEGREIARLEPEGFTYIHDLFEDRQGAVWIVAGGTGLIRVTASPFRTFGDDEGAPVPSNRATVVADGSVIVSAARGSRAGTAFVVRGTTTSVDRYRIVPTPATPPDMVDNPSKRVGFITEDGAGRRWGSFHKWLFRLQGGRAVAQPATIRTRVWWDRTFADPADPNALWLSGIGADNVTSYLLRYNTEAAR